MGLLESILGAGALYDVCARGLDFVEKRGAPLHSDDFVTFYSMSVRDGINVLPSLEQRSTEDLERGLRGLMAAMGSLVHAYHKREESVEIRTNLMIPLAPTEAVMSRSRFCEPQMRRVESYSAFLDLRLWDWKDDRQPTGVVLPVELAARHQACLPGAPRAYLNGTYEHVTDTTDPNWWSECDGEKVREQLGRYFLEHQALLRSFVSFPVRHPQLGFDAPPVAVINVQSSRTHVLGRFRGNWRKLALLVEPLLAISSYYVIRLYSAPAAGNHGAPAHV
jgi:hypothetical protein